MNPLPRVHENRVLISNVSTEQGLIKGKISIQLRRAERLWYFIYQVASYRLIGYENRAMNDEYFNDDKKDAGDIGVTICGVRNQIKIGIVLVTVIYIWISSLRIHVRLTYSRELINRWLCPMKYVSSFRASFLLFVAATSMSFVVSGCVATKEKNIPVQIISQQQYDKLIKVNEQQRRELKTFKQLSAQLQLNLLEKDVELNRLTMMNEQLIREFVHKKVKLRNRGDKVETVSLLAEVATLIGTAKENPLTGSRQGLLEQAEQYQAESKVELKKGDFESAFHLAGQALKLVETIQQEVDNNTQQRNAVFVKFTLPLPMALLKTSNVRAKPSIHANVQRVLDAGSQITAVGHTGEWVKVKAPAQGLKIGWIHYVLLGGTRE